MLVAQDIAALTAVSGVLYCFKKHLTSVVAKSFKARIYKGFAHEGDKVFSYIVVINTYNKN